MSLAKMRRGKGFTCPYCRTLAYFEMEYQWPTQNAAFDDRGNRPVYPPKTQFHNFHVGEWSCSGCKGRVVLVYPQGLNQDGYKAWPVGSSRSLGESTLPAGTIPPAVVKDFKEAAAVEELSPTASATLSRRCLQFMLKDKQAAVIGAATKLKAQVKAVLDANIFPGYIADELHGIRSIGNNAAHANVDPANNEIIDVEASEAAACLDVIEQVANFLYVEPLRARERKAAREAKNGPDTR
jgi:hypothetical protein